MKHWGGWIGGNEKFFHCSHCSCHSDAVIDCHTEYNFTEGEWFFLYITHRLTGLDGEV